MVSLTKRMTHRMLRLAFSETDQQALRMSATIIRIRACSSGWKPCGSRVQGLPHHQIAQLCAISANTLRSYLKLYHTGGVEALKQLNFHCPQSLLRAHQDTIEAQVRAHPPQTINEAVAMLAALTGIKRSPTQVRLFLKHLGLQRRKVGLLPAKGDPECKRSIKKRLEPRLAEAQAGKRTVFLWMPLFVFGAFLGYLWCFARCWIKAPSGQQRFNVLGALNAITYEVITVTNRPHQLHEVSASAGEAGSRAYRCRSPWSWTMRAISVVRWSSPSRTRSASSCCIYRLTRPI